MLGGQGVSRRGGPVRVPFRGKRLKMWKRRHSLRPQRVAGPWSAWGPYPGPADPTTHSRSWPHGRRTIRFLTVMSHDDCRPRLSSRA